MSTFMFEILCQISYLQEGSEIFQGKEMAKKELQCELEKKANKEILVS